MRTVTNRTTKQNRDVHLKKRTPLLSAGASPCRLLAALHCTATVRALASEAGRQAAPDARPRPTCAYVQYRASSFGGVANQPGLAFRERLDLDGLAIAESQAKKSPFFTLPFQRRCCPGNHPSTKEGKKQNVQKGKEAPTNRPGHASSFALRRARDPRPISSSAFYLGMGVVLCLLFTTADSSEPPDRRRS